jgi:translation initiation factor IF-3
VSLILSAGYGPYNQKPVRENEDLVNNLIRFPEVLLIDSNGQSLGIKSRNEALRIAEEANLDLLCVAPMAKPPVCKIVDYGKYRFEQQKKAREIKKKQKIIETKEVRFTPQTDKHDLEVKARAAIEWLQAGNRVKVTVRFRGRQLSHLEIGEENLQNFIELVKDYAIVEKNPTVEGRNMFAFLGPKKDK